MPRYRAFRDRPRLIAFLIAVIAFATNWLIGPRLYPEFYFLVSATLFSVVFFVWLIDAIIVSVRTRLARKARARQLR
jgi:hypothetical protein